MEQELTALLGRAPSEDELAIARDQRARVETGIFANPLLDPPGNGTLRPMGRCGALAATDPFAEGGA
ncbi:MULTISPECIES: hypothetical protein [Roseobacteraceae]|uniref:hypothetical protein n=1 Tax=Roseobacteraceae TaxID=2854170 RepID=UPI00080AAF49|nr:MULTISPECIES: hypothetical protein [Roseobacteraceae]ANT60694.1 hypothetical protein AYJ57_10135 [Salipiger sp. CCB-MM3]MCA0995905.1 hypothetical protein [Alloyangia pacifica]NDV98578.1 hypothetical protein [Salipiger sp. PrR002]NDW57413.1 hypothetical protein [Salipiger sp. PrR004]